MLSEQDLAVYQREADRLDLLRAEGVARQHQHAQAVQIHQRRRVADVVVGKIEPFDLRQRGQRGRVADGVVAQIELQERSAALRVFQRVEVADEIAAQIRALESRHLVDAADVHDPEAREIQTDRVRLHLVPVDLNGVDQI